jgi:hypothetical protein
MVGITYINNVTRKVPTMTDQEFQNKMNYFFGVKEALGFETVWSMYEFDNVDQNIFKEGVKRVCYKFYSKDATVEELMNNTAEEIEVSSFAASGSVRDIWKAAESCFQQAKALGDWHYFIEDIEINEDGSYELVMGS